MDSTQVIQTLAVFVILVLAAWAGEILFYSDPEVPEISYGRFLDKVYGDKVESVLIGEKKIFGVLKPAPKKSKEQVPPPEEFKLPSIPLRQTPWRVDFDGLASIFSFPDYPPLEGSENAEPESALETPPEPQYFVVRVIHHPDLINQLRNQKIDFSADTGRLRIENFLKNWVAPIVVLGLLWVVISARRLRPPRGALEFGKNKIRIYREDPKGLPRFADLAGIDPAIDESREIVTFLKDPERFTQLGASLPNGVLLIGPPGSGKTLLAKALAGESGVPFFNLDGAEFRERFSAPGAPKMSELFLAAQGRAPCILFIDGLDAMLAAGARRDSRDTVQDAPERLQNQLLFELDKLDGRAGIMTVASLNRPETLISAWTQPSRFNRRIVLERPYKEGREDLLRKFCSRLVLADDVDFSELAAETIGMVGAEIENLCNESALLAARCNREKVTRADFREAHKKATAVLKQKDLYLDQRKREVMAYHEAGHALARHLGSESDSFRKVTLIPGFFNFQETAFPHPNEGRPIIARAELLGKVRTLLAGRAAEETVFGEISTGAMDDLEKANRLIRKMLIEYGMSSRFPNLSLTQNRFPGETKPIAAYSAKAGRVIGQEHIEILETAYQDTKTLIQEHRASLDRIAQTLLDKEKIVAKELKEILASRPKTTVVELTQSQ